MHSWQYDFHCSQYLRNVCVPMSLYDVVSFKMKPFYNRVGPICS